MPKIKHTDTFKKNIKKDKLEKNKENIFYLLFQKQNKISFSKIIFSSQILTQLLRI